MFDIHFACSRSEEHRRKMIMRWLICFYLIRSCLDCSKRNELYILHFLLWHNVYFSIWIRDRFKTNQYILWRLLSSAISIKHAHKHIRIKYVCHTSRMLWPHTRNTYFQFWSLPKRLRTFCWSVVFKFCNNFYHLEKNHPKLWKIAPIGFRNEPNTTLSGSLLFFLLFPLLSFVFWCRLLCALFTYFFSLPRRVCRCHLVLHNANDLRQNHQSHKENGINRLRYWCWLLDALTILFASWIDHQ